MLKWPFALEEPEALATGVFSDRLEGNSPKRKDGAASAGDFLPEETAGFLVWQQGHSLSESLLLTKQVGHSQLELLTKRVTPFADFFEASSMDDREGGGLPKLKVAVLAVVVLEVRERFV